MPHPFFEASTYPWHRPEAVELHKALFQAVRDFEQIELVYVQCKAGLLPLDNKAAHMVWKDALERLTTAGALPVLCHKLLADSNLQGIHGMVDAVIAAGVVAPTGSVASAVQLAPRSVPDTQLPKDLDEKSETIFVCYASPDAPYRAALARPLKALPDTSTFFDVNIAVGTAWRAQIGDALERASVGIVLVSSHLLISEFVRGTELPILFKRWEEGSLALLVVHLTDSVWELSAPRLGEPQWPLRERPTLIGRMVEAEAENAWSDVARAVHRAAKAAPIVRHWLDQRLTGAQIRQEWRARVPGVLEPTNGGSPVDIARTLATDLVARGLATNFFAVPIAPPPGPEIQHKRHSGQLDAGDKLGRWWLGKRLGRGGFATVWEARDEASNDLVALKVLHTELAGDERQRERFFRGARTMAGLAHPAIVRVVVAMEEAEGLHFFAMEHVDGEDLQHAVVGGRVAQERILPLVLTVGDALALAHVRGLVHRDVKPANILLGPDGEPKLTDFDLVRDEHATRETRTGAMMGTLLYAAPESMEHAREVDARADVFGLAMTAVFALHGRALPVTVLRHTDTFVDRLDCAEAVKAVLKRALDWDRDKRFADAGSLCAALKHAMETPPGPWVEQGEDRFGRWATFAVGDVTQRMRWIPPGTFLIGSPESDTESDGDERPQHEVTLTSGYWLAETPCTQALWQAVMGENPSEFKGVNRPVETVSWDDCQRFIERINVRVPGLDARLPSEAEWEYACRGGTTGPRYGELDAIAWYGKNSKEETHPVGLRAPNPRGLHDMLGNVLEWCQDWFGKYDVPPATDPGGPEKGSRRVVRGGSWLFRARRVRAADRDADPPGFRRVILGLRLARGPAPGPGAERSTRSGR